MSPKTLGPWPYFPEPCRISIRASLCKGKNGPAQHTLGGADQTGRGSLHGGHHSLPTHIIFCFLSLTQVFATVVPLCPQGLRGLGSGFLDFTLFH